MTRPNATRRKPLPGKRKVFPTDKLTLRGRYMPLSAAQLTALWSWANSGPA